MSRKIFPRAFLIGCDKENEWMLEWFIRNYTKHQHKTKFVFADFGVSQRIKNFVDGNGLFMARIKMEIPPLQKTWFMKPEAMWFAPVKECVWIDIDCEIKENIDGIFDELVRNKLNMVEDKPWTKRRGETWHNSGVVGFIDKPNILKMWAQECKRGLHGQVGDQEVLHHMIPNPIMRLNAINDLPNEYNVVRLQTDHDNYKGKIKVMHHTGAKGKEKIRSQMYA